MPGSISIDTLDTHEGSFIPRSRASTHSMDSWAIVTAAASTLSDTSEADPAIGAHARLGSQLPDTSTDLTRNWLTTTAPPPFSRKGVAGVVMPVKATRPSDDVPRQKEQAQSTSRAQQEEGGRSMYGRHRRAMSQLQPQESMRVQPPEEGEMESKSLTEERTLGWVTLRRGMSIGSSRRRPGLRERKNNADTHEDSGSRSTVTGDGELGLGAAGKSDGIEGKKQKRMWPWDSFLKIVDKRLGKKDTL